MKPIALRRGRQSARLDWIVNDSLRRRVLARQQTQDQQIRRLEGSDGDIVQILITIHHMAANHRAKLVYRYAQLFSCLGFRVLRLPCSSELHFEHSLRFDLLLAIVENARGHPN
jgi:hypothetical protein